MCTGSAPFQGSTPVALLNAILNREPDSPRCLNPQLPFELERIIAKALEKNRELRYQAAAELKVDLKRLKRDLETSGRVASDRVAPVPVTRRRWGLWGIALTGVSLMLALAFALWMRAPLPPPKVVRQVRLTNDGSSKDPRLATDGSRIYFSQIMGARWDLAQVSSTGGETVPISATLQHPFVADISPSRSELLVINWNNLEMHWPVWVLPMLGGSARRLENVRAQGAAWSPDGQQIVYAKDSELYLAKSDGSEERKLVDVAGRPYLPRWSPDGTRLRFTVADPKTGTVSLWDVAADGTNLHRLLPGWSEAKGECCGNWTFDGKYFVFEASHNTARNVWAIREKGGFFQKFSREPVQLTTGPINFAGPVPSRDGKRLFVVGVHPRGELIRYDAKSRQWEPYLSGISVEHLNFSRDGQWITYVAYPEATLWRSRVDGAERLQLSSPALRCALPSWSPDGKQIAFMARIEGKPWKIYRISAEGGSPQEITAGKLHEADPGWSPDGNQLVFGRLPWLEPATSGSLGIYLIDLKTHQLSTLPDSARFYSPRWSPDGRFIVATTHSADDLVIYDFTTKKWTELVKSGVNYPSWSRDGRTVYFARRGQIESLRISDLKLKAVVRLKDIRGTGGHFGPWVGTTPDDSLLLLRDVDSEEIYALEWQVPH